MDLDLKFWVNYPPMPPITQIFVSLSNLSFKYFQIFEWFFLRWSVVPLCKNILKLESNVLAVYLSTQQVLQNNPIIWMTSMCSPSIHHVFINNRPIWMTSTQNPSPPLCNLHTIFPTSPVPVPYQCSLPINSQSKPKCSTFTFPFSAPSASSHNTVSSHVIPLATGEVLQCEQPRLKHGLLVGGYPSE